MGKALRNQPALAQSGQTPSGGINNSMAFKKSKKMKKKKMVQQETDKYPDQFDYSKKKKKVAKKMGGIKLTPVSKGHKPKGAHGHAAVKALGRTKTTGNFAKIEAAKGKGAAIAAYQNKLRAHQASKKKAVSGKEMLGKAMKRIACKK